MKISSQENPIDKQEQSLCDAFSMGETVTAKRFAKTYRKQPNKQ